VSLVCSDLKPGPPEAYLFPSPGEQLQDLKVGITKILKYVANFDQKIGKCIEGDIKIWTFWRK
jgi:hypothetical protein